MPILNKSEFVSEMQNCSASVLTVSINKQIQPRLQFRVIYLFSCFKHKAPLRTSNFDPQSLIYSDLNYIVCANKNYKEFFLQTLKNFTDSYTTVHYMNRA